MSSNTNLRSGVAYTVTAAVAFSAAAYLALMPHPAMKADLEAEDAALCGKIRAGEEAITTIKQLPCLKSAPGMQPK